MQKITKREAAALFNEGKPIYICGCKVQPNKHNSVLIIPAEWNADFNSICEKFIKQFKSTSAGYYCSYYISNKAEKTERNKFFKNF